MQGKIKLICLQIEPYCPVSTFKLVSVSLEKEESSTQTYSQTAYSILRNTECRKYRKIKCCFCWGHPIACKYREGLPSCSDQSHYSLQLIFPQESSSYCSSHQSKHSLLKASREVSTQISAFMCKTCAFPSSSNDLHIHNSYRYQE